MHLKLKSDHDKMYLRLKSDLIYSKKDPHVKMPIVSC